MRAAARPAAALLALAAVVLLVGLARAQDASITYGLAKLQGSIWWVAIHESGEVVPLTNLDEAMSQPIVHGCTAFDTERVQFMYQTPLGFLRIVDIRDGTSTDQRVPYLRSNWQYDQARRTIYGLASRWISESVASSVSTLTPEGGGSDSAAPASPSDRSALVAFEARTRPPPAGAEGRQIDEARATAKYVFEPELSILPGPAALNPTTRVYYCTLYNATSGRNVLARVAVENGTADYVPVDARVTSLDYDPERSRVVALAYDTAAGKPQIAAYDADTGRRQRYLEQDLEYVHPFRTSFNAPDGALFINSIDPGSDGGANIQFDSIEYDTVNWFRKRKVATSVQLLFQITRPGFLFERMDPARGGIRGNVEVLVGGYSVPAPNQFAKLNLTCRLTGRAPESELNFTVEGRVTGIKAVGRDNFVRCLTPDVAALSKHYPRLADPYFPQTPYQPVAVNLSVATDARTYFSVPLDFVLTADRVQPGFFGGGIVLVAAAALLALVACCPLGMRWFRPSRVRDPPRTLASDGKGDAPLAAAERRPVEAVKEGEGVGLAPPARGLFADKPPVDAIGAPRPEGRFWLPPAGVKEAWATPAKPPGQARFFFARDPSPRGARSPPRGGGSGKADDGKAGGGGDAAADRVGPP